MVNCFVHLNFFFNFRGTSNVNSSELRPITMNDLEKALKSMKGSKLDYMYRDIKLD